MPAVAVITLIGVALLVAVLAGYLIRVALILRHVVLKLNIVLAGVVAVNDESGPIGPVADAINADLDAGRKALDEALARRAEQSASQSSQQESSTERPSRLAWRR